MSYKLGIFGLLIAVIYGCKHNSPSVTVEKIDAPSSESTDRSSCAFQTGWTSDVRGGLDGKIIRVTNLNSSGDGSLASAIKEEGPRLVVFEVGGVIDLEINTLKIKNPNITIAGQTAPPPGITLIRGKLRIDNTHDVVLQHLRIRPGTAGQSVGWKPDGLTIWDSKRVIVDHLSLSWGVDENLSVSGTKYQGATQAEWRNNTSSQITISNSIIAEGLHYATHENTPHSKGSLISQFSSKVFIYNNLYANNYMRNPRFAHSSEGVIVNNYIANPGEKIIQAWQEKLTPDGNKPEKISLSIVGNFVKGGKDTTDDIGFLESTDNVQAYLYDNIAMSRDGSAIPTLRHWKKTDRIIDDIVDQPPLWPDNFFAASSVSVSENIWKTVGARPEQRDNIDQRIIEQAKNNSGRIIDNEKEVGGYPSHKMTTAAFNRKDWDECMDPVN